MKTNIQFWAYLDPFFLVWEMFQKKSVEKIKTNTLYLVAFSENPAVYEIMWKNTV